MSNKIKNVKNITNIDPTRPAQHLKPAKQAQEWADQIQSMIEKRDEKCEHAKESLVNAIMVASDKYRTANGVLQALNALHEIWRDDDVIGVYEQFSMAKGFAMQMSADLQKLKKRADSLGWAELDKLCDEFYDQEFASEENSLNDLVMQMLHLNVCQNFGPNASDITEFLNAANDDIAHLEEELEKLCKENKIERPAPTTVKE